MQRNLNRAILLDRDGTLIVDKAYLNDPAGIVYLDGVFGALKNLRDAGFIFVVVTNQSGIPRGIVQPQKLTAIHRQIQADFSRQGIDILAFYYAPYLTEYDHILRKPNPGMLLEAARDYKIDLGKSYMIGDRMVDVEAGHRAGTQSILVGSREDPKDFSLRAPDHHCANVLAASKWILEK